MGLTIDDIYDKEFTVKGGGYDRDEVDQFLDEVCDEMTNMQEKAQRLEDELNQVRQDLQVAQSAPKPVAAVEPANQEAQPIAKVSQTLQDILVSAQRLSDDAVDNAKRRAQEMLNDAKSQADAVLREAQERASSIVDDAQEEKNNLTKELETLKKSAIDYRESYLQLLDKHRRIIDEAGSLYDTDDIANIK